MTWSIIARDDRTGEIGIAVATKFFAVGARVPYIEVGAGALATQALMNPLYGRGGLALLRQGLPATEVVRDRLARAQRQEDRADEMAAHQGVRATDLWRAGIVDRVVPERPDAADEPVEFCLRLGRVLGEEVAGLLGRDDVERFRSRLHRYRHLGR